MSTFQLLAARVARALRPLAFAMDSEDGIRSIMDSLGWVLPTIPPSLAALGDELVQLNSSLAELAATQQRVDSEEADSSEADSALEKLGLDLTLVMARFHHLPEQLREELPADFIAATRIDEEIEGRLFDWLISLDLATNSPVLYRFLRVAGITEATEAVITEESLGPVFGGHHIRWDRFLKLLDPKSLAQEVYGWGTAQIDAERLFAELLPLSMALSMPAEIRYATETFMQHTTPGVNPDMEPVPQLWIPLFRSTEVSFFIVATALPKALPDELQGLALALVPSAAGDLKTPITDQIELNVKASTQIGTGAWLVLRPDGPPDVILDMEGPARSNLISGSVGATLTWRAVEWDKPDGMSAPAGTQLTTRSMSFGLGAEVTTNNTDVYAEFAIDEGKLVVAPPSEDGFLSSVIPSEGLKADLSFALRWSQGGVCFRGSGGLATTIPLNVTIGPIALQSIALELKGDEDSLTAEIGLTTSFELGPVLLTIEGIGLVADFHTTRGNLGPFDLAVGFKSPTGAGLAVRAPGVVGGGFLSFDFEKHEYGGVLQLEIAEKISVNAIGLLSTRLPDGSKGYSLVLMIFVERFTPIQLGFGFVLTGIGGLLALNRTFNEEALRAGLKNHMLDSVMFPQDPIRNAPQIISNLNRVFPPAAGHHLFGPMVKISWGTPALITAEICVVLELGARLRLLILAQIAAILPRRDHDLVRLQMDAIGIIDFDQGTASLDASLYDSRLLKKFVLTGDMAMRLKWEGSPNFALAIGGLHPAFNPPVHFPKLERITINLSAGDNPRIRCEAYFALTANTVQFGARAELYAAASGFSIQGEIGYDVLIQFDPFFFIAEFHAQLQLKRGSTNLFKVKVEGSLAGPRPLHLKGKATFEILWWDVTVRVDTTLVKGEKPPLPAPIEVLPLLKEALRHPDSWTTQLAVGQRPLVTLNARPGEAGIRLHPLGTLQVKENVVPLNMDISRFGQATPAGERRFTITDVTVGDEQQVPRPVRDFFAPAQFLELTDDEKLSRPSFEPMDAGVALISDAIVLTTDTRDWLEVEAIEFETWILDKGTNVSESDDEEDGQGQRLFYRLSPLLLSRQSRFGAAANSELRRTGKARYHTGTVKHQMAREGWTIVDREQLSEQPVTGVADRASTYSEAVAELSKLKQETPAQASRFRLLRPSELQQV